MGLDHRIGEEFVISIRPPSNVSAARFIKACIREKGGRIVIRLPIERVSKQIKIRWGNRPTDV